MSSPSVDEIAEYAANLRVPSVMVGDCLGNAFIRVDDEDDYDGDGRVRSREFPFDSIVVAKAAFDTLCSIMDERRRKGDGP